MAYFIESCLFCKKFLFLFSCLHFVQVMQCVMKLLEDLKVQIEKREAKDEDDYDYEDGDEVYSISP